MEMEFNREKMLGAISHRSDLGLERNCFGRNYQRDLMERTP
jgi:hypothetical protein